VPQERGYCGRQAEAVHGGVQGPGGTRRPQGGQTANELAAQPGAHPTLIHDRKRRLLAAAEQAFADGVKVDTAADAEAQKAELFEQIGRPKPGWSG
jgi:hypothetical protein